MVLNLLGAEKAAYYYIAFAISNLIFMIPYSVSMSLLVEGSHGRNLKSAVLKSLVAIYALLVPTIMFAYFCGNIILNLFGREYTQAFGLLRILALSSFFVAVVYVYLAIKRVQMHVKSIILLNFTTCLVLLFLSYIFIPIFDITGVGYVWIVTYVFASLVVGFLAAYRKG